MAYSYLIIDSSIGPKLQLQNLLEDHDEFYCTSIATNLQEGLNGILKHGPDVVFVYLNHDADATFSMVMEIHQYLDVIPKFIAISKTREFAYPALKNGFFDYWLLPFGELDVRKSLLRLRKLSPKEASQTLCIKSYSDFRYLNIDDILYLQADNNTTEFIMRDGTINNAFKTLKTFEDSLPKNFVRIHQSFIVNVNHISRISYGKAICALKYGNKQLPFSKSYRKNIDSLKQVLAKNAIYALN